MTVTASSMPHYSFTISLSARPPHLLDLSYFIFHNDADKSFYLDPAAIFID